MHIHLKSNDNSLENYLNLLKHTVDNSINIYLKSINHEDIKKIEQILQGISDVKVEISTINVHIDDTNINEKDIEQLKNIDIFWPNKYPGTTINLKVNGTLIKFNHAINNQSDITSVNKEKLIIQGKCDIEKTKKVTDSVEHTSNITHTHSDTSLVHKGNLDNQPEQQGTTSVFLSNHENNYLFDALEAGSLPENLAISSLLSTHGFLNNKPADKPAPSDIFDKCLVM